MMDQRQTSFVGEISDENKKIRKKDKKCKKGIDKGGER